MHIYFHDTPTQQEEKGKFYRIKFENLCFSEMFVALLRHLLNASKHFLVYLKLKYVYSDKF